jgi:hypothetical protein
MARAGVGRQPGPELDLRRSRRDLGGRELRHHHARLILRGDGSDPNACSAHQQPSQTIANSTALVAFTERPRHVARRIIVVRHPQPRRQKDQGGVTKITVIVSYA